MYKRAKGLSLGVAVYVPVIKKKGRAAKNKQKNKNTAKTTAEKNPQHSFSGDYLVFVIFLPPAATPRTAQAAAKMARSTATLLIIVDNN